MPIVLVRGRRRPDPHKPRSTLSVVGRVLWRLLAQALPGLVPGPRMILLAALAACLWAWGTPHLRVRYTYTGQASHPVYVWCEYGGVEYFRIYDPQCPLVLWRKLPKNWSTP